LHSRPLKPHAKGEKMRGFQNLKVGEDEYQFGMLDPFKASKLIAKIIRSILQPIGAIFTGLKSGDAKSVLDANINFESAFSALSANITEDEFNNIVRELLSTVSLGTGMPIPEDQFLGRVFHMYKVAYKSFEVNFSDFLSEKNGPIAFLKQAFIRGQVTSNGSSGALSSQELPRSMKSKGAGQ
jgi:hypothetical protein